MHFAILSLLGVMSCFLVWCGQVIPQPPIDDSTGSTTIDTGTNVVSGDMSTGSNLQADASLRQNGLHHEEDTVVTNNEQIPYAIALPLVGMEEESDPVYAQRVFVSKDPQSNESVTVRGMGMDLVEDSTLQQLFEWKQNDMMESGLNPTDGHVNEAKKYFVINGELPNLPEQMYTDIYFYFTCKGGSTFTDSVAVSMVYDKADKAKRQTRIERIQKNSVQHVCE